MNIDCFGTVTVHVLYYYNLLLSNSEVLQKLIFFIDPKNTWRWEGVVLASKRFARMC